MDLETIRREYLKGGLHLSDLDNNPFNQFELWMKQAIASDIQDPTAMTLSTVNSSGQPSQRIVLLKHFDTAGFVFYTNYSSQKAQDIANNNKVSLHFPWYFMERQIMVLGIAEKVSQEESKTYFATRPLESQIAAWASDQSSEIASRDFLIEQFKQVERKYSGRSIPLPEYWGGYRVLPEVFEFWQGGANRLHDRYRYQKVDDKWRPVRLAP